jgi:hypothetical protein
MVAGTPYYVRVGADCTTSQAAAASGDSVQAAPPKAQTVPASQMSALYYGTVRTPDGRPIAPGTKILGQVAGSVWGEARTFRNGADTVFVLYVAADDPLIPGAQGAQPGSPVKFLVDGVEAPATTLWAGGTAAEVNLTVNVASYRVYMPTVRR